MRNMNSDQPLQHDDDFTKITRCSPGGAKADIYPYGAQLTSWITASGREWIFLSEQMSFAPGKAIRGGVPIIFPQFNERGSGQRHGFARTLPWQLCDNLNDRACFQFYDSQATSSWPYKFLCEMQYLVEDDALTMILKVQNTDSKAFSFTCALHTYLQIDGLQQTTLSGLDKIPYWDNNGGDFHQDRKTSTETKLSFDDAIDRVYFGYRTPLVLTTQEKKLQIAQEGFSDVVVWNPGMQAAKDMADLADREYQSMLCVEAAQIDANVQLAPGESWEGSQILRDLN